MKMHEQDDLKRLISWIESQPRFKPKNDLTRMKQALKLKQLTLNDTYMIHVAGTNGKGSTSQFLTRIFLAQGLSVGTFTSPYILQFNERININGKPLSDDYLENILSDVKAFNHLFEQRYGERLSFFELLTLAGLITFQRENLDVVIMEVGIGGLLDATNAYDKYNLSLITNIGLDHMKQLGNTLESIAFNKLGILRKKGTLLTTVEPILHHYFKAYTKPLAVDLTLINPTVHILNDRPLSFVYQNVTYQSNMPGRYQIPNAILAIEAAKKTPFNIDNQTINLGLMAAYLPARFTYLTDTVIIDGAHNIHAIHALKQTILLLFPHQSIHVIFSALGDKDIQSMLDELSTFCSQIDLVSFPDSRYESLQSYQNEVIRYVDQDAILYLDDLIKHKRENDIVLITGSLHFVGYMMNHYK